MARGAKRTRDAPLVTRRAGLAQRMWQDRLARDARERAVRAAGVRARSLDPERESTTRERLER